MSRQTTRTFKFKFNIQMPLTYPIIAPCDLVLHATNVLGICNTVARLFGDQRIFVSAPQYHWHVQGGGGADDKAKHHIDILAQRLHQFGHWTKEREWNCGTS